MDGGRVVQVGSPQSIYETPASRFVADFIGSSNVLAGRVIEAGEGGMAVQLAGGEHVRIPRAPGLLAGLKASVVVRPDRMEVTDGAVPEGWNTLDGRVVKVSYLGTHLQIVVRTPGGVEITAHHRSPTALDGARLPEVGALVHVTWPAVHSLGFPE
jgi:spermidine/putrescine transport system ATP-binding protein